jgi:hypothetical protein
MNITGPHEITSQKTVPISRERCWPHGERIPTEEIAKMLVSCKTKAQRSRVATTAPSGGSRPAIQPVRLH